MVGNQQPQPVLLKVAKLQSSWYHGCGCPNYSSIILYVEFVISWVTKPTLKRIHLDLYFSPLNNETWHDILASWCIVMHVVVLLKGWSIIILWGEIEVGKKVSLFDSLFFWWDDDAKAGSMHLTCMQQYCFRDTACLCVAFPIFWVI